MYNLEATPAEGTTYRFAKEDRKRWPDILQAGTASNPYYTNSSQLPAGYTDDPFEALEHQNDLQRKYTGGTVLHLYMSQRASPTRKGLQKQVRRALERGSRFPTSRSPRRSRSATSTAISPVNISSAPNATRNSSRKNAESSHANLN